MAVTVKEFLELLQRSRLLAPELLDEAGILAQEQENVQALATRLVEEQMLSRWQANQLLAGGRTFFIGNYKMIRLLGRGGMGKVYLAEHKTLARLVAVKLISEQVTRESDALERFLAEARAIAALDHPNIVQAYSVDNVGEWFYLVMEYIDGKDLNQLVEDEGPLDYRIAADCARQAADGLEHGHSRNFIHRDIKPSNLLVNHQGVVKIADMGLAQLQDSDRTRGKGQNDDSVLGSVDYLAPEQALGNKEFNHRADIYSLGCTLYFLLTGRQPFPGGLLHEKLMKHQSMQPQSIKELRSNVPRGLIDVVAKMMAKKPDDRYQSAGEVSKVLSKFPAAKRRVKPVLKTAEPLPDANLGREAPAAGDSGIGVGEGIGAGGNIASGSGLSLVQTGGSGIGRRPAKAAGFLQTPQGKIIAGIIAGIGAIILAAIVIPLLNSTDKGTEKPLWLTDTEEPAPDETSSPVQPKQEPPDTAANPLGIKLGRWYKTEPLASKAFTEPLFPERGVNLPIGDVDSSAWKELPEAFDGAIQILPGGSSVATYISRTIEAANPVILPVGFGSNHMLKIWLNGGEIPLPNVDRTASIDSNQLNLALGAGENRLLLKIYSLGGDHKFCFAADLKNARLQETASAASPAAPTGAGLPNEEYNLVFDFESGDLQGWKVVEGDFKNLLNDKDEVLGRRGEKLNKQGKYFLDTAEGGGNSQTGLAQSPAFRLEAPTIRLLVGGSNRENTGVKLFSPDHKQIGFVNGPGDGFFEERTIEGLEPFVGKLVYLQLVDKDEGDGGFVLLDNVRLQGRIEVDGQSFKRSEGPDPAEIDPFVSLGTNGNLNPLVSSDLPGPCPLGTLTLTPESTVELALVGGRKAARGPRTFLMGFDETARYWLIALSETMAGGTPERAKIACIALKDQTLYFAWMPGAVAKLSRANCLLNCGLNITIDGETRFLPLARPQMCKPVVLDLDKSLSRSAFPADRLPDDELVRLQIARVEGFPKPTFDPSNTVIPGGTTNIKFAGKDFPDFRLHVAFDFRARSALVEAGATVDYQWPTLNLTTPRRFVAKEAQMAMDSMVAEQQTLLRDLEATNVNDHRRRDNLKKKLTPISEQVAKFTKLNEAYARTKKKECKIHFRVCYLIDPEHQITLLKSYQPPSPKAKEGAPPAKSPPVAEVSPLP